MRSSADLIPESAPEIWPRDSAVLGPEFWAGVADTEYATPPANPMKPTIVAVGRLERDAFVADAEENILRDEARVMFRAKWRIFLLFVGCWVLLFASVFASVFAALELCRVVESKSYG